MFKLAIKGLALVVLAGCAVGPEYQQPEVPSMDAFSTALAEADFAEIQQQFWTGFDDPLLSELIDQTLAANQTLQAGYARYEQAAALFGGARRDQWPSVAVNANASEIRPAQIERGNNITSEHYKVYSAGVAASWEIDLFGRLRQATTAQRSELDAAGADLQALQISLVGELASSYFELRGLQQQYQVAKNNVELYQESLAIVSASIEAGRGTDLDRSRAQAQLESARAALPSLDADIYRAMHRIAVLSGQPPNALVMRLSVKTSDAVPVLTTMPAIPVDSPSDLLRRRPDVIAAERRLASATARIGVAVADLFPRFTLGGLLSSVAGESSELFTGSAESRRVFLGVDWTFLNYGKVKARIDAADANSQAALADYRQTVLNVLEETETRLVFYDRIQHRVARLRLAEEQAKKSSELAQMRYRDGFISYFEVLEAEQVLAIAREATVQSQTTATIAMVDVYRAVAGPPG